MKIRLFIFTFFVLFSMVSVGQEIRDREKIFIENLNSFYKNPDQSIKVAKYLLENASSNSEKAKAHYLLSESKILIGNTTEGIEDLFKAKELLKEKDSPFISSLVLISLSEKCRMAGMGDIASSYFEQAKVFVKNINSENEAIIAKAMLFSEKATISLEKNNIKEAEENLKQLQNTSNTALAAQLTLQNKIGSYYIQNQQIDSSEAYFHQTLSLLKPSGLDNSSIESTVSAGLGKVCMMKGDFKNSLQYFNEALKIPVIENSTKIEILGNLSQLYKRMDSVALSQKYYNEKLALNATMLDSERKLRSVIISHIDSEQQNTLQSDKKDYYKWGAFLAALFLLIFIGYYFYNRKLNSEYKRFQEVIAQVEKDEKLKAPYSIDDSSLKPSKGVVIPEETEKNILERLEEFETSTKFTNSNMNLSLLAKQLKTNSKYISEIIHTHKQKNFNTYINELRVNYIIDLMKTDKVYLNYKVSYLAETCGFSSHSAFTVVFKTITGFTPKQFITFLKKSRKEKLASF